LESAWGYWDLTWQQMTATIVLTTEATPEYSDNSTGSSSGSGDNDGGTLAMATQFAALNNDSSVLPGQRQMYVQATHVAV
jgi:hypothetical protein